MAVTPLPARWVVGLDTSLTGTGIAAIDVDTGSIRVTQRGSKGHRKEDIHTRYARLSTLRDEIMATLEALDGYVLLAGIEGPSYSSKFGSPWDRAGLWWMVVNALHEQHVPVALVAPQGRAKYATGKGTSAKALVLSAALDRYPEADIRGDNEGDAVVISAMMARKLGRPIDDLPDANLEAMEGVEWPEGLVVFAT